MPLAFDVLGADRLCGDGFKCGIEAFDVADRNDAAVPLGRLDDGIGLSAAGWTAWLSRLRKAAATLDRAICSNARDQTQRRRQPIELLRFEHTHIDRGLRGDAAAVCGKAVHRQFGV